MKNTLLFSVRKDHQQVYSVVVKGGNSYCTAEIAIYTVSGGRDPKKSAQVVADSLNKAYYGSINLVGKIY